MALSLGHTEVDSEFLICQMPSLSSLFECGLPKQDQEEE